LAAVRMNNVGLVPPEPKTKPTSSFTRTCGRFVHHMYPRLPRLSAKLVTRGWLVAFIGPHYAAIAAYRSYDRPSSGTGDCLAASPRHHAAMLAMLK
jgi:hypothetical protein